LTHKLNIVRDRATDVPGDNNSERLKFYESSVAHPETGERLLSVIAIGGGDGLRMTEDQVAELAGFLKDWLEDA